MHVLRLETGIHQKDAIALYRGWGFKEIPVPDRKSEKLLIEYEASVDSIIRRSIAKISFNYLAYWQALILSYKIYSIQFVFIFEMVNWEVLPL